MTKIRIGLIAGVLLCTLFLAGCGLNTPPSSHIITPMHDPTQILLPAQMPVQEQKIILNTINRTMEGINEKLSLHVTDSELNSINRIGNTIRLPISRDTYNLLQLTQSFNQMMDGLLDITVAPIAYLWGFHGGQKPVREVSSEVLNAALDGVGFDNIQIYKNAIELRSPYTRINFEELAQAYAMDLSILKIRRLDHQNAYISMNGLARGLGSKKRNTPWTYPVFNPFSLQEIGSLSLSDLPAAATAQTGQNYMIIAGQKYGHIIDPRTGFPAQGTASVTVLAPSTTEAAALARAIFVAGLEQASSIMKKFPRCEILIIPDQIPCTLYMTQGMADHFTPALDQEVQQKIMSH